MVREGFVLLRALVSSPEQPLYHWFLVDRKRSGLITVLFVRATPFPRSLCESSKLPIGEGEVVVFVATGLLVSELKYSWRKQIDRRYCRRRSFGV